MKNKTSKRYRKPKNKKTKDDEPPMEIVDDAIKILNSYIYVRAYGTEEYKCVFIG